MASDEASVAEIKISLDISFKRDSSGTWDVTIGRPKTLDISDLMEALIGDGTSAINFKGKVLEASSEEQAIVSKRKLVFHERGGQHTALCDNGLTAFAFGNDIFKTWTVTKYTLQLNELFEVELKDAVVVCETPYQRVEERVDNDYYHTKRRTNLPNPVFCIGVTTTNPASFEETVDKRPNGWYWSGTQVYVNETASKNLGTSSLKIGDRVGVLQDNSGKLHFFVNGVDQGEYQMSLPYPLYGCIQLSDNHRTATIKDPDATYGYLLKINAEKKQ